MAKHNQRNTLGSLTDFQSAPQPTPETTDERIHMLERRILHVETLLNDVMHEIDKPYTQPKGNGKPPKTQNNPLNTRKKPAKAKKGSAKKTPPSEIITALLKHKPQSRSEMEAETGLDTEAVKKCVTWMSKKDFIEKTTEKDDDGNSRWQRKQ